MKVKKLKYHTIFKSGDFLEYDNHILVVKNTETGCDKRCFFHGNICPYFCENTFDDKERFYFEELSPIELMILKGSDQSEKID